MSDKDARVEIVYGWVSLEPAHMWVYGQQPPETLVTDYDGDGQVRSVTIHPPMCRVVYDDRC